MASPAQMAANRANAQKSTGPRTLEGKQRASMSALKHGLAAQTVVLPHEDNRRLRGDAHLALRAIPAGDAAGVHAGRPAGSGVVAHDPCPPDRNGHARPADSNVEHKAS